MKKIVESKADLSNKGSRKWLKREFEKLIDGADKIFAIQNYEPPFHFTVMFVNEEEKIKLDLT